MDRNRAEAYQERFDRVLDHIDRHLDQDLSLERLSQIAAFSKYHFHRQFSEYVGVGIGKYIQLMRLRRASFRLAFNPRDRIIDIALDANFENPESFSRAFKIAFGQTPSEFRSRPAWPSWRARYSFSITRERSKAMNVKIVIIKSTPVAELVHHGRPETVNDTVRTFIDWRKSSGFSPVRSSRTFGIAYCNPDTTEPDLFRFGICGEVSTSVPDNPQGVVNRIIPDGRCATVRHIGSHERLGESIYPLYRDWLPGSGEELRDFPLFFHYLNLLSETPEHELLTDIYLPLM